MLLPPRIRISLAVVMLAAGMCGAQQPRARFFTDHRTETQEGSDRVDGHLEYPLTPFQMHRFPRGLLSNPIRSSPRQVRGIVT